MNKQLLVDYTVFEVSPQQINESLTQNNGRLIVNGVLQRANAQNQNGRVYPMEILQREAKKYSETFIAERRALGELDHPDSSVVNLNNVSHNVLGMNWTGNDLKALFQSGIKLGISSRGMGSVKEVMREGNATLVVQDDFDLIAFDFVSNPSTHGAFLSPVNESVNKVINDKYGHINRIIQDIIMEF